MLQNLIGLVFTDDQKITNKDLQKESRNSFQQISKKVLVANQEGVDYDHDDDNDNNKSSSSTNLKDGVIGSSKTHEAILADMIQNLGPAFTSTDLPKRLRGLYALLGAIEGCTHSDTINFSNPCLVLLGNFFSLQCGPIVDDEYEEDYDSMIRDISIQCLSALVATPQASGITDQEYVEGLQVRIDFATNGVERRCANAEESVDFIEDETENFHSKDIRGGLAILPRSKRSLCFILLRQAVIGVSRMSESLSPLRQHQKTNQSLISSVQRYLIKFGDFIARCIPGESDPRCLMQLLELLHTSQLTFYDWFSNVVNSTQVFPNEDYFDAVAPYYPIQFTPPPNNIHGITREGLHTELISVLTFTRMDGPSRKYSKPTMLECTINLFLDQLLPGEENCSVLEKLECMECISCLLFPGDQEKKRNDVQLENQCSNLTIDDVRNLSKALIATHDEASINVSHGGDISDQCKVLAEICRNFASRVARELERFDKKATGLWEAFVSESLENERKKLEVTPAFAKTTIAYEASLAASGGPRTLRICLTKGLEPLIEFLLANSVESDDALAAGKVAAVHGIAAFFSSSQITMSKLKKEGVSMQPHPLETYAQKSCSLLLGIIESDDESYSQSLKSATASCLECLLISCTAKHLQSDELDMRICVFLKSMMESVVTVMEKPCRKQLTYSKVLGRIVGISLNMHENDNADDVLLQTVLMSPKVQECVQTTIFPELKASALLSKRNKERVRYDRLALTIACSLCAKLASTVVSSLLESLLYNLKKDISSPSSQTCLEALSDILQSCDGENAICAFHENDTVDDIVDVLCTNLKECTSPRLRDSISQIALTATNRNENEVASKIDVINVIKRGILPAYKRLVPLERLKKLLSAISKKIPPLSQADELDLLVKLPILSTALHSVSPFILEKVVSEFEIDEGILVSQLLQDFTEYILSTEHFSDSRTAGALCVHAILKRGFSRNHDCPAKPLLVCVIKHAIATTDNIGTTKNCLNYLSLLTSAAALRGSTSSSNAAEAARFLMETACEGFATLPFLSTPEKRTYNLSRSIEEDHLQVWLQVVSASAYGAILMEDDVKPLMKQRLIHICLKYTKKIFNEEDEQVEKISIHIGLLMVVCYVVCASDLSRFDCVTARSLARVVVRGLSSAEIFQVTSLFGTKFPAEAAKARGLVISALFKFICISAQAVDGLVLDVVSGLLRSYGVSDLNVEIGCKLVTLQALEAVAHLDGSAKATILQIKPAVIAILSSAMTQKSCLLRSAAVDVRNTWCLL